MQRVKSLEAPVPFTQAWKGMLATVKYVDSWEVTFAEDGKIEIQSAGDGSSFGERIEILLTPRGREATSIMMKSQSRVKIPLLIRHKNNKNIQLLSSFATDSEEAIWERIRRYNSYKRRRKYVVTIALSLILAILISFGYYLVLKSSSL